MKNLIEIIFKTPSFYKVLINIAKFRDMKELHLSYVFKILIAKQLTNNTLSIVLNPRVLSSAHLGPPLNNVS